MEEKTSRYVVRPPRDLSSHFERRQAAKAKEEEEKRKREGETPVSVDYVRLWAIPIWPMSNEGKIEQ